jgi:hypothetical protein
MPDIFALFGNVFVIQDNECYHQIPSILRKSPICHEQFDILRLNNSPLVMDRNKTSLSQHVCNEEFSELLESFDCSRLELVRGPYI